MTVKIARKKGKDEKRGLDDISDWPGWIPFLELYKKHEKAPYPEDSRTAFLLIFEGGFRASEAIQIRKDQCKYNEYAIVIEKAPVLKKKEKTLRDVIIKLDEHNPLGYEFIDVIENTEGKYIFPKHTGFSRTYIPGEQSSRMSLYRRINEIGNLFPHSLRSYRAMMLVYERDFTVQQLVKWFEWTKADMAVHYTRTRDIAKSMGIKELPR